MSDVKTAIAFFASSAEQQIEAVPNLPFDAGAGDFYSNLRFNPLLLLLRGLKEDSWHHDYETWEEFITRTDFPVTFPLRGTSLEELVVLLSLVDAQSNINCFTQRGLKDKVEWRLVRRLSQVVLQDLNWQQTFTNEKLLSTLEKYVYRQKNP